MRFATGLSVGIVLASLVCAACARHFQAEGVVLRVEPGGQSVLLSHKAIPGYMEAMAMPFTARHPPQLADLTPGSRVSFQLDVARSHTYVDHIHKLQAGLADIPLTAPESEVGVGQPVPDFALNDQHGTTVRLSDFRGRMVAIDFIYTRCPLPDVCPRLSANFAFLQKRLGAKVALLSITIDPQFDTPAVLLDYARRWQAGADWHFLTGSAAGIQTAAGHFGLVYWPEEGMLTHTSATSVVGTDGRLMARLAGSSFTAKQLLDLVQTCLESSR